jgi:CheY-like chemotaxis protein
MTIARTILPEPCTVLLVEDYYANILVATTLLEQYGYTVDIAKSGFEALDKFRENRYSAILMDVQMQEMDGLETTRRIREQEATLKLPRTPIIAMTAHVLD